MNKPLPYLQFFTSDFLTGCGYMSMEERGMYITLLCYCWETQTIPKKRVPFIVQKTWEELSDELKSKFIEIDGGIVNKRIHDAFVERDQYIERQRINGAKGGRPKTQKKVSTSISISNSTTNSISNSISNSKKNIYVPSEKEFMDYSLTVIKQLKKNPEEFDFSLRAKYESWLDDNWKDGYGKPIKNWKNKVNNTIPHLKANYGSTNNNKTQYSEEFKRTIIENLNT